MGSFSSGVSLGAMLFATFVPAQGAIAEPAPINVHELQQELMQLQLEQRSTDQRIQALERRIDSLVGRDVLDETLRLPDSSAERMRGRGLSGAQAAQTAPSPKDGPPAPDESRKTPANSEAVEAVTRNEQGYFGRRFTLEPGLTYSHFSNAQLNLSGFLALDAIFLGLISLDQLDADVVSTDLTARYGAGRIQADVNIPYLYRRSNFRSGGAGANASGLIERTVSTSGMGDVSGGLSYRLWKETASRPDVVVNLRGKAPTGREPFGIELVEVEGSQGNLKIPSRLSTGSGVWGGSGGVSILKTIDPMVVFGSFTYFHNFERHFGDIDEAEGDQPGRARLGDAFQYGLGVAFALNDRTSLSTSFTQRFVRHARLRLDPTDPSTEAHWQTIVGSEANVGVLNLGATFSLSDRLTIVSNLGVGITQDAPDMVFTIHAPYRF